MSQTAPGASTDPERARYHSLRDALVWLAGMLLLITSSLLGVTVAAVALLCIAVYLIDRSR